MFAGIENARDPVGLCQQRCVDYRKAETRAESGKISWYKEILKHYEAVVSSVPGQTNLGMNLHCTWSFVIPVFII